MELAFTDRIIRKETFQKALNHKYKENFMRET